LLVLIPLTLAGLSLFAWIARRALSSRHKEQPKRA
jgi:hypothetical protein